MRHHRRTPSVHREIKVCDNGRMYGARADMIMQETLNARSEYTNDESEGYLHRRINQYVIKEEIGRGSYGAVHLATDQFGNEFVRLIPRSITHQVLTPSTRPSRSFPRRGSGSVLSQTSSVTAHGELCASLLEQGLAPPTSPTRACRTSKPRRPKMPSGSSARRLPS